MKYEEIEELIRQAGFSRIKTGKKHHFFNGIDTIKVPKEAVLSTKNAGRILRQLERVQARIKGNVKSEVVENMQQQKDDPEYLTQMNRETLKKILEVCGDCSGRVLTAATLMGQVKQPVFMLNTLIQKIDFKNDLDTLFQLKDALSKVSLEPTALKAAVKRMENLTAPNASVKKPEKVDKPATPIAKSTNDNAVLVSRSVQDKQKASANDCNSADVVAMMQDKDEIVAPWSHVRLDFETNSDIPMKTASQPPLEESVFAEEPAAPQQTNRDVIQPKDRATFIGSSSSGFTPAQRVYIDLLNTLARLSTATEQNELMRDLQAFVRMPRNQRLYLEMAHTLSRSTPQEQQEVMRMTQEFVGLNKQ